MTQTHDDSFDEETEEVIFDDPTDSRPEEEHRFPCPTCGADMRFDSSGEALVCDHCGNREEITLSTPRVQAIQELDFEAAINAHLPAAEIVDIRTTSCPSCGAQVEISERDQSLECPFCATPVVVDTGTHRQIKPRAVLPFALEEKTAHDAMNDWLGRLWFAPNGLKDYARKGRKMTGIYVPYWTFDADTKTQYTGQRGTVYYTTRTVMRDGKRVTQRVQKVRWRAVSGRVARFFDDVLVLASKSLPQKYTDGLEPWDMSALQPYAPEFLAGYRAEGYSVELKEGFTIARDKMDRIILRDIKFDIGGDRQRVGTVNTVVNDVTFKHVLLPVWTAAYKFRGKSYRFVVNGQTGKVQGERPYSAVKIALAVIAGLIVAGVIGYLNGR